MSEEDFPRLVIIAPLEFEGTVLELAQAKTVIGHSDTADVVLDDQFVSRRHALITIETSGLVAIRDLKSTSGTFVNEERLEGPRVLAAGDLVRFADLVARFEPGGATRTAAARDAPTMVRRSAAWQLRGTVFGADGEALPTVEVVLVTWDPDAEARLELARTVTGELGRYELAWDAAGQRTRLGLCVLSRDGDPLVVVELGEDLAERQCVDVTIPSVKTPLPSPGAPTSTPDGGDDDDGVYRISGTVRGRSGEGLRDARVVVWWQQIRDREELAGGTTSASGSYDLRYRVPGNAPQPLLVIVEAVSAQLDAPLLSPLTKAQPTLAIDLAFEAPDQSEWARLVRSIEPLLEGLTLSELVEDSTHQDISFLAHELGQSTEVLMRVAVAARLGTAFKIPAPAFYAFLRQQVPAALPSPLLDASQNFTLIAPLVQSIGSLIFGLTAENQTQTLTGAVALDYIGPQFTKQISQLVSDMQALHTTDLLSQPYLVGSATLSQLLVVAGLTRAKQQTFAQALVTNTQTMRNFWRTLGDGQHGFTAAEASAIERTLSIGAFVKNFVPLIQSLIASFASGSYKTLADLARLSLQDWTALVEKTGAPPSVDAAGTASPAEVFASVVYTRVTRAYPTAALSGRIAAGTFVPQAQQPALVQFFQNNPDLELIKDYVPAYLADHGDSAFSGISQSDQDAVIASARSFQRVLRVAPNTDVAETLLGLGLDSATQIAALGQQQFFVKATAAGLTRTEATQAFAAAAQRYGVVVSTFMKLNRGSLGVWPKGMGQVSDLNTPVEQAVARDSSLATLFGSQDYCATDDCTSILSPAAYLCDLLLWLRNHPQGAQTALDVLDSRRPDIRQLLLNCPNTDTELPYVDLVNELLADRISPPTDPNSPINPPWKQTSEGLTAQQLSAAPEYFNQAAYVTLFDAGYPQSLPYSTGLDGLRTYLQHWNLPLWQLRQALLPLAGATVSQQAEVAAERFGMNITATTLVTTPNVTAASLATAWNTSDFLANTPIGLATVPAFLQAASITYESLLELLEVAWVQDGLGVAIIGINDLCDTSTQALAAYSTTLSTGGITETQTSMVVTSAAGFPAPPFSVSIGSEILLVTAVGGGGDTTWTVSRGQQGTTAAAAAAGAPVIPPLDPGFLDRANRFLRLWFATGYKMWELGLLLTAPAVANGSLDESALAALLSFRQLQDATGLAVDQQLALYQNIDTGAHRDPDDTATVPLYGQVFLNPTVTWAAPDPDLVNVSTGAPISDPILSDHLKAIQPALGVSGADLATLVGLTDNQLTLANLSLLYRVNRLAVASGFTISSLLTVAGLLDPAAPQPVTALAPLLASPAATLAFLTQATAIQKSGVTLDALTYLLTPPTASSPGGWATITQMTPSQLAAALTAVQQAEAGLLAASTTLFSSINDTQTSITVASDVNFPSANFYIYIGTEILLVTAVSGTGNTTWTVARGQQGTSAAGALIGTAVTPTSGDLDGTVIAAVAANAHNASSSSLANDVTALILQKLQVPGTGKTLLTILEDPALVAPVAPATVLTIGGTPATGDTLQTVLTDSLGSTVTVTYPLTSLDSGSVSQTASDFAHAINASPAVAGPKAFLAPCAASGPAITLTAITPGAPGATIATASAALPGGLAHVAITPATATLSTLPLISPASFPDQFLALQLFDKVGVLVRGLRLVATDFTWLLTNAAGYGGLDFTQLPVTTTQPALSLSPLLTTLLAIKLARLWTAANPSATVQTLYDVIGGVSAGTLTNAAQAQAALQTITGWPLADIQAFVAALGLSFPTMYTQPATYDALRTLEAMTSAVTASGTGLASPSTTLSHPISNSSTSITVASDIGFPTPSFYVYIGTEVLLVTAVSGADSTVWTVARGQEGTTPTAAIAGATVTQTLAAQLLSWATVPQDEISAESLAASALGVLKAQQATEAAWLALAPTLMNPIRDRRSAALQSYLIAQRDASGNLIYPDADALFDYFLIDVQMSSCQVTSRVVQAYIAVQIFVERCRMNLEASTVVVDLDLDDTWNQWEWMSRYRIWEANREVFLYPENWLIESQRPNRTEIYQAFEQEVRQGQSTTDYLETVVLNYIDRLDGLAHLHVTGTCEDPSTGTIYVVARTLADPPVFYLRSFETGAWTGWTKIPLDIKAYQVVPALYRGRLCLFWMDVKVFTEPQQNLPSSQGSVAAPSQDVERYVSLSIYFSIFRNGSWAPAQTSRGKLFDKPLLNSSTVSNTKAVEALYTLKILSEPSPSGYGVNLGLYVFRFGDYDADLVAIDQLLESEAATFAQDAAQPGLSAAEIANYASLAQEYAADAAQGLATSTFPWAKHVGYAVFDGRFGDLELNNFNIALYGVVEPFYPYAQSTYGPDAQPLLPLSSDLRLVGDSSLLAQAGALVSGLAAASGGSSQTLVLDFTGGPLLNAAPLPLRVVGPDSDLVWDPSSYFFFQDNRRCYWVESENYYWTGSAWSPVTPADPSTAPYQVRYVFHPFYHPFTRLFWNQLSGGGFDLLYDVDLQQVPDDVDPSYSDVFSFQNGYSPTARVQWDLADATTTLAGSSISASQTSISVARNIWVPSPAFYVNIGSETLLVTGVSGTNDTTWTVERGQQGSTAAAAPSGAPVTPTTASQDRQFLDFSYSGAFSVYNWELFYHIPLYIAQLLSQNQQFEDAQTWFNYIFDPTRQGNDPVPERFWIPKPLHDLSSSAILAQDINVLLQSVNQGDPTAIAEVQAWRSNPFNPFVLADMRSGVPYMKSTVMSYLDNLITWGDNLFSTESREALSEATLIYVIASEILGPDPVAVTPPMHADDSFDTLEPSLDAFANAVVAIENVIGGAGATGSAGGGGTGGAIPAPQTFYFTIPSNPQLLGYWTTVADRLYKLRHCQSISGAPLQLALFDAPIDPGLLIAAQAAGVDLSSVVSDLGGSLPNYRFTALYPQALDFVNAVRAYGSSLQAALEKSDAGALALLQQTTQQQLLSDGSDILDWQVQQAQSSIDALNETLALAQQKLAFNTSQSDVNAGEAIDMAITGNIIVESLIMALLYTTAGVWDFVPQFYLGAAGFGGTPSAGAYAGGDNASKAASHAGDAGKVVAAAAEKAATLAAKVGTFERRRDNWNEAAAEAQIQVTQANIQLTGAQLALQVAQQNQTLHQEQIDNIQKQIDFLNDKFTSDSLYDWMVSSLAATYFQSYQLAYQMCKQVERCYQFELGILDSSFIQFGYWDSLYKGLLSGETLNQDLRRLQASYLQQNARRYELSRYVSLGVLDPTVLQQLLVTGACDFTLPESLFDNDYPGHYNRRLTRVSLTVVYPNPGKFDNVKATLTLTANQVRINTDPGTQYPEKPLGADTRFVYNYAAVPQKVAMGNAQDDPGLFITTISSNIADQRYLPFENAGAVSTWHLEMPESTNEIDLSTVGDVVLHLYYTALDGGAEFQNTVVTNNEATQPTSGIKVFSAQNDFAAPAPTAANPYPVTPWQAFLATAVSPANQTLTLSISPSKFPAWTRGKTISVTSLTVLTVGWPAGSFTLAPQAPLPTATVALTPVPKVTEPNVCSGTIPMPANTPLGPWSFELQQQGAADFRSLSKTEISDVLLLVSYAVS